MVRLNILIAFFISIFLIVLILVQTPKENIGLSKVGSSRFFKRFFKIATSIGILIYLVTAINLNLLNNEF